MKDDFVGCGSRRNVIGDSFKKIDYGQEEVEQENSRERKPELGRKGRDIFENTT